VVQFLFSEKGAYYIDQQGGETRLQYLNFANGKSTTVARNLGPVSAGLTATPDGKTILFTRVDASADDLMLVENFVEQQTVKVGHQQTRRLTTACIPPIRTFRFRS
jgi:hypothetical protein